MFQTSWCICRFFHTRLQTSVLRSDFDGQATLLNLLLRNYLHYNLIEQADKLVTKSTFPEHASNNEWARFLYYLGKVFFIYHYKYVSLNTFLLFPSELSFSSYKSLIIVSLKSIQLVCNSRLIHDSVIQIILLFLIRVINIF